VEHTAEASIDQIRLFPCIQKGTDLHLVCYRELYMYLQYLKFVLLEPLPQQSFEAPIDHHKVAWVLWCINSISPLKGQRND
jgi:hypothetical protein